MRARPCPLRTAPSGPFVLALVALLGVWLGGITPADAQYSFTLSSPTIIPGTAGDVTLELDSTGGQVVNGLSIAFCYDEQLALVDAIDPGAGTTALNGGSGADFFNVELTTGTAVVAIIPVLTTPSIGYAPGIHEVFIASVTPVGNPGTLVDLTFCSTPSVDNVVSAGQPATSVAPTLNDGTITTGMTQGGNLTLAPVGPPIPGETLAVPVLLDASSAVETISFGFVVPSPDLSLSTVTAIGDLAAANGGSGPSSLIVTPAGAGEFTVEVIVGGAGIAPGIDVPVLQIDLDVDAGLSTDCAVLDLAFSDAIGSPAVPILVTNSGLPLPTTSLDTTVRTASPANLPPSGGTTLSIGSVAPTPGSLTNLEVVLDSDEFVAGLSFGLTFDPTDITLIGIQPGLTLQNSNCGAGPDFLLIDVIPGLGGGLTFETTIETMSPVLNPLLIPDGASSILGLTFTISPSPQVGGSSLTFTDTLGTPAVPLEVQTNNGTMIPATDNGEISLFVDSFIRGDCNADTMLDIGDAISSLSFLFSSPGSPIPQCDNACDANDDGAFNVADPIFYLGVLFTGGGPIPPPNTCGTEHFMR